MEDLGQNATMEFIDPVPNEGQEFVVLQEHDKESCDQIVYHRCEEVGFDMW